MLIVKSDTRDDAKEAQLVVMLVLMLFMQVTNIAPQATRDQMHTLFSFLGKIEDLRLYPSLRDASINIQSRVCFVKVS